MAGNTVWNAGIQVSKGSLDSRASDAILTLRNGFNKVESISVWLSNNPKSGDVDPLVSEFGYTTDEAYLIRILFEGLQTLKNSNSQLFQLGRKLTGLE